MKKSTVQSETHIPPQTAEDLLPKNQATLGLKPEQTDALKRIQELEVRQNELETQNKELQLAKERAEVDNQKYNDLYDLESIGYFTLSKQGVIIDVNLNGEKMLGKERVFAINCRFDLFVSPDTKSIFELFLDNIFKNKSKDNCELTLLPDGSLPLSVHLRGVISATDDKCLVTVVSNSEHKELSNLNEVLLSSLPYPAMYIRKADRVILAANKIAQGLGAEIGRHCWRSFGGNKHISDEDAQIAKKYPGNLPEKFKIKCSFCLADHCFSTSPTQNNPELYADGRISNTYWIKVSDQIYLHYFVDITEHKQAEELIIQNDLFLKKTQQIAMLGTYSLDLVSGKLISSEVLNNVLGVEPYFYKSIDSWVSIVHPDWKKIMIDYVQQEVIGRKTKFDKEFKIIRQNDQAERWVHGIGEFTFNNENHPIKMIGTIRDITERKDAEFQLIRNLKFTEALLKSIPIPVFYKDSNGLYIGCNEAFSQQRGVSNGEIKGKSVMDLWPTKQAEIIKHKDLELLSNPEYQTYESKLTDKDKQIRDVIYAKNVYCDETGQVAGIVGAYIDITDRKLTENALKESEETFRTVANYTNDWEFWIDQQGNFQYCSPSCEEITGYSAAEFLQNPRLLSDIVFPDDQIVFQYHKQMEEALIDVHQEIQFRIIKANGQIRWVGHVCKYVFDEIGNYTGIRGSNRDITKRKETEHELKTSKRKYKLLSLNITDGVFICKNAKFDYVNKGMNAIFGYEYSELKGKPFLDLILPLFHENLDSFVNNNSHTNQILNIEIECYKKDLSIIVVEVFLNYVADEKSIYGVAHDITEKKHIQKKNILKAIIQTEEKEKAHFSKELHDGIGPLLSTIKLYLQWTIRLKSIKKRNEIILKAEAIVEDALETVKEISNKLSPHLLANYGLTSALQSFTNKIGETTAINITVESNVSRRIDVEIEAAIYRAMIECINNTIKYANATNIYILLNDIGSQIQINYRDNGIGFNLEETKAAQKGLGLFNLQNRIQTIGGEIEMHSEIGQGVNYQFIVPL